MSTNKEFANWRVLIIDDSASVRQALQNVISSAPDLEVMATASDPFVAAQRIHARVAPRAEGFPAMLLHLRAK